MEGKRNCLSRLLLWLFEAGCADGKIGEDLVSRQSRTGEEAPSAGSRVCMLADGYIYGRSRTIIQGCSFNAST